MESRFCFLNLPTLALSISPIADSARFVRTEMVEVLHSDYIELARAKDFTVLKWHFDMVLEMDYSTQ